MITSLSHFTFLSGLREKEVEAAGGFTPIWSTNQVCSFPLSFLTWCHDRSCRSTLVPPSIMFYHCVVFWPLTISHWVSAETSSTHDAGWDSPGIRLEECFFRKSLGFISLKLLWLLVYTGNRRKNKKEKKRHVKWLEGWFDREGASFWGHTLWIVLLSCEKIVDYLSWCIRWDDNLNCAAMYVPFFSPATVNFFKNSEEPFILFSIRASPKNSS